MSSDAALLQEIQRLKGAIDRHKNGSARPASSRNYHPYAPHSSANKKYVNPAVSGNHTKSQNATLSNFSVPSSSHQALGENPREVVIDGVKFESSQRKLTRKDLKTSTMEPLARGASDTRLSGTRGKKGPVNVNVDAPVHTNMIRKRLPYARSSYLIVAQTTMKTVVYHTTPLHVVCLSVIIFLIMVGVLAKIAPTHTYASDRGIDCDKQHVRECPDFAEKGSCPNKSCKLPHVIRANMRRKPVNSAGSTVKTMSNATTASESINELGKEGRVELSSQSFSGGPSAAEEFISLTFEESEDESDDDDDDEIEGSDDDESATFEDQDLNTDPDTS
ncbi:hypothetical protein Clacol_005597 [Clathrus columnatus]|uniref:C3H1-type domain-containing protein n=1 Tax=Clathrus columnatus TaxID=1419009 RepID=A0AAV5AHF2_9AGAM|nr:hypothetical protein Clacol_005597 [Clathrus columnatus]